MYVAGFASFWRTVDGLSLSVPCSLFYRVASDSLSPLFSSPASKCKKEPDFSHVSLTLSYRGRDR